MHQFLNDQKFFVINVTKLWTFLQLPQYNTNNVYQNDLHFMFYPTVWKSAAKMI